MHDRLILKTILQKNTVLKLMRYLALSLPVTSSIKKSMRDSTAWHSGVEKFEPLELVSCRDELHKIFKFPTFGANTHVVIKK
jgi:predicted methyltransferase